MTYVLLTHALCGCLVVLSLCTSHAAAVDMNVDVDSYQLHPAGAQAPGLRLTAWPQETEVNSPARFGLTLTLPTAQQQWPAAPAGQRPLVLDLGLRWRSALGNNLHLDVSAWGQPLASHTGAHDAMGMIREHEAGYGTRVELQWSNAPKSGFLPEHGAVGMQLQGGSRVVLRAKRGGPMVYFRSRF